MSITNAQISLFFCKTTPFVQKKMPYEVQFPKNLHYLCSRKTFPQTCGHAASEKLVVWQAGADWI